MGVIQATGRVTGNITAQNSVPAGVATAGSAVEISLAAKQDTLAVQVSGTYGVSALSLQVSVDGTTWYTKSGASDLVKQDAVATATIPAAAVGIWRADVAGYNKARITALGAITGTAAVVMQAGNGTV